MEQKIKIYLDTSVPNFLFAEDAPELKSITVELFENFIRNGTYVTLVSNFVIQEINQTENSEKRNQLLKVIERYNIAVLPMDHLDEIRKLAEKYIKKKIIPPKKIFDALHIACSVIHKIDYLVSWNYQHLANVNREKKIIEVNIENNHLHPIRIITPLELIDYGT